MECRAIRDFLSPVAHNYLPRIWFAIHKQMANQGAHRYSLPIFQEFLRGKIQFKINGKPDKFPWASRSFFEFHGVSKIGKKNYSKCRGFQEGGYPGKYMTLKKLFTCTIINFSFQILLADIGNTLPDRQFAQQSHSKNLATVAQQFLVIGN